MGSGKPFTRAWVLAFTLVLSTAGCGEDTGPAAGEDGIDATFLQGGKADAFGVTEGSADALKLLRFVNSADLETFTGAAGITSRAASSILAYRAGRDGELGTGDDRTIDALVELDGIPWVGPVTFARLLEHARTLPTVEQPPYVPYPYVAGDAIDLRGAVLLRLGQHLLPEGYTRAFDLALECRLTGQAGEHLQLACGEKGEPSLASGAIKPDGSFSIGAGDATGPTISGSVGYGPSIDVRGYWQLTDAGSTYLHAGGHTQLRPCDAQCSAPGPAWQEGLPLSGRGLGGTGTLETERHPGTVDVSAELIPCGGEHRWKLVIHGGHTDIAQGVRLDASGDGSFEMRNHRQPTQFHGYGFTVRGRVVGRTVEIEYYREYSDGTDWEAAGTIELKVDELPYQRACF